MAKVLIIYHSQSGHTETMAKAIYEGAASSGVTVRLCGSLELKKAAESVVAQREPSSEVLEACKELSRKMARL